MNDLSDLKLFAYIPPKLEISIHIIRRSSCRSVFVDAFLLGENLRGKVP